MMNKAYIKILIILAVAAILVGTWFYFGFSAFFSSEGGSASGGKKEIQSQSEPAPEQGVPAVADEFLKPSPNPRTYENKELGFSLTLPEEYKVSPQEYAEEMKVVVFGKTDGSGKEDFQIFVYPYDEPGPITPERIWIDEPDMIVDQPRNILIDGVAALVFFGEDPDFGKTREVWMVQGGMLYQISSAAEFEEKLSKIMATFKFLQ